MDSNVGFLKVSFLVDWIECDKRFWSYERGEKSDRRWKKGENGILVFFQKMCGKILIFAQKRLNYNKLTNFSHRKKFLNQSRKKNMLKYMNCMAKKLIIYIYQKGEIYVRHRAHRHSRTSRCGALPTNQGKVGALKDLDVICSCMEFEVHLIILNHWSITLKFNGF